MCRKNLIMGGLCANCHTRYCEVAVMKTQEMTDKWLKYAMYTK